MSLHEYMFYQNCHYINIYFKCVTFLLQLEKQETVDKALKMAVAHRSELGHYLF